MKGERWGRAKRG